LPNLKKSYQRGNNVSKFLPEKAARVDEDRKERLLRERQDKALADMQKRNSTPVIKDTSLSSSDSMKVKSSNAPIDTKEIKKIISGNDFVDKIASLRAAKAMGKKALGVLPFAGTAMALASGDPAMAAEEAAGDIPVLGQAYEALKPTTAGNVEEENTMMAEIQARKNYGNSPAAKDAARGRENIFRRIEGKSEIPRPQQDMPENEDEDVAELMRARRAALQNF
jgi:hypothetical protein